MQLGVGLLAFGLIITCVAGYRALLYLVDLLTGNRHRPTTRPADLILYAIAVVGVLFLLAGLWLVHHAG